MIDADLLDNGTRHPNLALMKISAFNKSCGHYVELVNDYNNVNNYDILYISKVFNYTKVPEEILEKPNIKIGGTGFFFDGGPSLEYKCEHSFPDYQLYNTYVDQQIQNGKHVNQFDYYLKYSIGFSTRGCFRKCDFCVNKKYDNAFKHSPIKEFLDIKRPYICLWDDNFLAFKKWELILDELESVNKPFQFRQGLDIRLVSKHAAKRLSSTKYKGDFIFAFDHIKDKSLIEKKLFLWRGFTDRTTKLYILCAFESQDELDIINIFERIKVLMTYNCIPYLMRYEAFRKSKFYGMYVQLARWCNQPQFFKKKSFREFCEANQYYHKNPNTFCSAYKVMVDFEKVYPEIAKKYFDLKYENLKYYK